MKKNYEKHRDSKTFRRTVRQIVKSARHYYSVPLVAFFLLLILLAAILILRYARYSFAAKTWIALLFLALFLAVVTMLGGVWGMFVSGFRLKRTDEHVQTYFDDIPAQAAGNVSETSASARLRMGEGVGQIENTVFLIAALFLWLGMDWLLKVSFPIVQKASFLTLLLTWFPAVRLARLIRAGYERIFFYKPHPSRKERRRHGQAK